MIIENLFIVFENIMFAMKALNFSLLFIKSLSGCKWCN